MLCQIGPRSVQKIWAANFFFPLRLSLWPMDRTSKPRTVIVLIGAQ
jgi:hypothetical protein